MWERLGVDEGVYRVLLALVLWSLSGGRGNGQAQVLDSAMHHLRNREPREWTEFPLKANGSQLTLRFTSKVNDSVQSLYLRQYDVKQDWAITVNGHHAGSLVADEKDMITCFTIPKGALRDGGNTLEIKTDSAVPDDIRVGRIMLDTRPVGDLLSAASMEIHITDLDTGDPLPGRITITDGEGILQTVTSDSTENLAIRPGYVYTGSGNALIGVPAGSYTVYAGRGFEYGIDSVQVDLKPGDKVERILRIRREVPTDGWVSCDTHVHTFTYSGHGDASLEERALTLAGEGVELPVITDHNRHVNLKQAAISANVSQYFTPVTGNELTTKVGHFCVFQTDAAASVIDHQVEDWDEVIKNLNEAGSDRVVVLNHARDVHNGFRPFDPAYHLSDVGVDLRGWKFPANGMEVMNSGSQQTDIMTLYSDWFGMLNRGYFLTPAGSSDSHDVSRYTVGQGRTYIRAKDDDPSGIDVNQALKNFREGKVIVSLGLLTRILVNDRYGPGEIVSASAAGRIKVAVEVCGPSWTKASRVTLYANGEVIRQEKIKGTVDTGVKWRGTWELTLPAHDIFLVAIAEGPGGGMPYWPIAKPYQPASPEWCPRLIGSTGAVWIDADQNGKANSAHDYAGEIVNEAEGNIDKLVSRLTTYDEAVAKQAATLWWEAGGSLTGTQFRNAMRGAAPATKMGFGAVAEAVGQTVNKR